MDWFLFDNGLRHERVKIPMTEFSLPNFIILFHFEELHSDTAWLKSTL